MKQDPRITLANAWYVPKRKIRTAKPKKLPQVRHQQPTSLADYLANQSEFGGTDIERIADGAAHKLGFRFDAAQYVVQLMSNGSYTVIDRVIFNPLTAVYLDGIQHFLRDYSEQKDLIQDNELKSLGWIVVRIKYTEILTDPIAAIRRVRYGY
jgi:hypothetical protein